MGVAGPNAATAAQKARGYGYFPAGTPLVTGFLKIERQRTDGTWQDVTAEILNLGFTERSTAQSKGWRRT